jgi:hypothetical protein
MKEVELMNQAVKAAAWWKQWYAAAKVMVAVVCSS